jgi:hypothetical protein
MNRQSAIVVAAAALAQFAPLSAAACGVCVEDKVAATYDHAVIEHALAERRQVVFVGVDGPVEAARIDRAVAGARVRGVVPGTLRTSASPPAFSFVLERKENPAHAVAAFRSAVNEPRARLTLLRVVRDGRMLEAP